MNYFVTAIGTDSGKTIFSAILTEALGADYWKPIQAGTPTDSGIVRSLISEHLIIHPETIILKKPASPHDAAKAENTHLSIRQFKLPDTDNDLIIEGAGGILVPINHEEFMIDMAHVFKAEVILVCNLYLGSINHTLLSLEALRLRKIPLRGIVFNGPSNSESESIIQHHAHAPVLLHLIEEPNLSRGVIKKYADQLKKHL